MYFPGVLLAILEKLTIIKAIKSDDGTLETQSGTTIFRYFILSLLDHQYSTVPNVQPIFFRHNKLPFGRTGTLKIFVSKYVFTSLFSESGSGEIFFVRFIRLPVTLVFVSYRAVLYHYSFMLPFYVIYRTSRMFPVKG
jgi:hypothetical protein